MGVFSLLGFLSLFGLSNCVEIAVEAPVFDIRDVNHKGCTLEEGTIYDVSFKTFITKIGPFKKLVDGGNTLWEAKADEECITINFFSKGEAILISLITRAFNLYFHEKKDGEWRTLTEKEFDGRLVSLNSSFKPMNMSYQLELGSAYDENCTVLPSSWTKNGVDYQFVSVRNGPEITSVVDNGQELWRSNTGTKCVYALVCSRNGHSLCRLILVGANNADVYNAKYYENNGGEWKDIEASAYDKELSALLYPKQTPISVNIHSSSNSSVDITEYNDYGIETRFVSPTSGYYISALYSNENKIWEGTDGSFCTSATFYKGKGLHVGSLIVDGNLKYVTSLDDFWGNITAKTFSKRLAIIMGTSIAPQNLPGKVLNISQVDDTIFKTFNYLANRVPMTKYIPNENERISAVVDGTNTIWKAPVGSNGKCLLCELYSSGKSKLIVLYVTQGTRSIFKYYVMDDKSSSDNEEEGGKWKVITKFEFAKRLGKMKYMAMTILPNAV